MFSVRLVDGASRAYRGLALAWLGLWLTSGAVVGAVAMQVVKDDYFPPRDSMSQYGTGADGWVFSITVWLLGLGSLALVAAAYVGGLRLARSATALLAVWAVCFLGMGLVPADPISAMDTFAGDLHMGLASVGFVAFPIAILVIVNGRTLPTTRPLRLWSTVLALLSGLSLILLVIAGYGTDFIGIGTRAAWSLYQSISVVLDIVLVYLLGGLLVTRLRHRGHSDTESTREDLSRE